MLVAMGGAPPVEGEAELSVGAGSVMLAVPVPVTVAYLAGVWVDPGCAGVLGSAPAFDVVDDESDKVLVAVRNLRFARVVVACLAGPGGQSCGPVAVEFGAGVRDPVSEAVACVGEVAVPSQWC